MAKKYFSNLPTSINEVVVLSKLELIIPTGFKKKLNTMEIMQLANDQLLQYGLQLHNQYILGSCRIVEANKNTKPLQENYQISMRLREYFILFEAMEIRKEIQQIGWSIGETTVCWKGEDNGNLFFLTGELDDITEYTTEVDPVTGAYRTCGNSEGCFWTEWRGGI